MSDGVVPIIAASFVHMIDRSIEYRCGGMYYRYVQMIDHLPPPDDRQRTHTNPCGTSHPIGLDTVNDHHP